MALIKCPECGKEIVDSDKYCRHCGYPLKNKQVVESDQNNKKQPESHVIAYRSSPGSVVPIYIVCFVIGLALTAACIILGIYFGEVMWLSMSFVALLVVILDIISIYGLIKVGANAANKLDCIKYDALDCKFVLCTLWGKEIRINPSDYVELKDNFFTDNMLMFTYRLPSGHLKKVNLGSCADRDGLRARINKVIEKIEK